MLTTFYSVFNILLKDFFFFALTMLNFVIGFLPAYSLNYYSVLLASYHAISTKIALVTQEFTHSKKCPMFNLSDHPIVFKNIGLKFTFLSLVLTLSHIE
jgi:hypothetical protein